MQVSLLLRCYHLLRKILIPFDFNTNKRFPTNVFQSVGKKISYLCFQAGSATVDDYQLTVYYFIVIIEEMSTFLGMFFN